MPRVAEDRSRDGNHRQQLSVGAFRVDAGALQVESNGETTRLKPKAMGVLLALAREPGVTKSRDELLDEVWGSVHVTPGVVGHAVTALRRAFGDNIESPTYIETIPRIGYRLVAPVQVHATADAEAPAPPPEAGVNDAAPAAGSAAMAAATATAGHAPRVRAQRWLQPLALGAMLLAAAVLVLWASPWKRDADIPVASGGVRAESVRRVTYAPGSEDHPRLNPGGDWLVYTRRDRLGDPPALFLQSMHGTGVIPLAGGEHAERPAWSPDGREVAYVWRSADRSRCEIRATTVDGGGQQSITTCPPDSVVYLDWNPVDADQIAWSAIVPGSASGSRVSLLRRREGWMHEPLECELAGTPFDLYPRFSPDGQRIAFRGGSNPTSDLYSIAATGGKVERLTTLRSEINGFDWLPDGSGLVFSSNHEGHRALYALDLASSAVTALGITDASSPDVANRDWNLAFQLEAWLSALAEHPLDGGPRRLLAPSSGRDYSAAMSADDARVVFASNRDGSSQLWVLDRSAANAEATRLTRHEAGRVAAPVLSADGSRVLYVLRVQGRHELHEFDFGQGQSRLVAVASTSLRNAVYASDDRSIWYAGWHDDGWYLHACRRADTTAGCSGQPTQRPAFRVARATLEGRAALLLAEAPNQGRLAAYAEDDLQPLDTATLAVKEPWLVVDDAVWSLQSLGDEDGAAVLDAHSLHDGSVTRLATLRGLRLLFGEGFQVSADRRSLVLPGATENRTDIGAARLVPGGG